MRAELIRPGMLSKFTIISNPLALIINCLRGRCVLPPPPSPMEFVWGVNKEDEYVPYIFACSQQQAYDTDDDETTRRSVIIDGVALPKAHLMAGRDG